VSGGVVVTGGHALFAVLLMRGKTKAYSFSTNVYHVFFVAGVKRCFCVCSEQGNKALMKWQKIAKLTAFITQI
jgi:hypothetical protein